jgi:hypothetical protein
MKTLIGHYERRRGTNFTRWLFMEESTGETFTGKISNDALITEGEIFDGEVYDERLARPDQRKKMRIELYLLRPVYIGRDNVRWAVLFLGSERSYLFPNNSTYRPFSTEYGQFGKLGKKCGRPSHNRPVTVRR